MPNGDYSPSPMRVSLRTTQESSPPPPRSTYDLADYLGMLRRSWWLLLAATVVAVAAAVGVTTMQTKVYEASTSVLVLPTGVQNTELAGGRTKTTINLDTEAQLVRSSSTAELARTLLKSSRPAADLRKAVSVTVPPNTAVLEITYAAADPDTARKGSHAFAAAYLKNRQEGTQDDLDAQVKALQAQIKGVQKQLQGVTHKLDAQPPDAADGYLNAQQQNLSSQLNTLTTKLNELSTTPVSGGRIISDAQTPAAPSRPVLLLNLAAGLMVGLVGGVALVVARQFLDRRVHRGVDVARRAGVPLLVELSDRQVVRSAPTADTVFGAFTPGGRTFSRLRNEVAAGLGVPAVVVVTGASRGPAAGTLAANLAVAFTRAGNQVALVYADVPASTGLFGAPVAPGLAEVLAGRTAVDEALVAAARHPGLRVLPTGSTASAAGLLQSEAARRVLTALKTQVEYVIVLAPSTAESADAQSLAIHADAVILAVDLRRTTDLEVADAAEQLHRVGTPLLGAAALAPMPSPKPRAKPGNRRGLVSRLRSRLGLGTRTGAPPDARQRSDGKASIRKPEAGGTKPTTSGAKSTDTPTVVLPRITDEDPPDTSGADLADELEPDAAPEPRADQDRTPQASRRRKPRPKRMPQIETDLEVAGKGSRS